MDHPVVGGIGGAAARYRDGGGAHRATPVVARSGDFVRRVESPSAAYVGRPGPGFRAVGVSDLLDFGDFLAVVNGVNLVPSVVPGVIDPVATHGHNIPGLQVVQTWIDIGRIPGSSGVKNGTEEIAQPDRRQQGSDDGQKPQY